MLPERTAVELQRRPARERAPAHGLALLLLQRPLLALPSQGTLHLLLCRCLLRGLLSRRRLAPLPHLPRRLRACTLRLFLLPLRRPPHLSL
jgi:hypothetical protein